MATRINNLRDLREEKIRLKLQLQHKEEKLAVHYRNLSRQLEPVSVLLDGVGWFSTDKEKGSSRAWLTGLVGTILKVGLPVVISKFFHKKPAENSWWGGIIQTLGSVVDKDLVKTVVENLVNKQDGPLKDMDDAETGDKSASTSDVKS